MPEPTQSGPVRGPQPTPPPVVDPGPGDAEPPTGPDRRPFRDEIVADVVRGWRRDLADVGGPNTLLWFRDLPAGTLDLTTVHPGGVSMLMAGGSTRLSHLVRERTAFAEARRRAQVIREKTSELRDERGLVSCFMALGMATWQVPGPQQPQAPVLLRPCTIHPVDAAMTDFDLDLGLDIEVNPVLVNYLRHEQGIDIDPVALADLAAVSTRFDPMRVFRELARTCAFIPSFSVTDRRVVTTFSYTKLPMVADLTEQGMALGDHEVLAALARVPGAAGLRPARAEDDGPLDPGAELLALDADTTQSRVVADVRTGRHLAVSGGPGTGKTRTVANLVAALAADGKRVLLLEQTRASLSAVTAHLDDVGLSGLVLDLHGDLPDAQTVAREVVTTLDRRRPAREPDTRGLREQLRDVSADLQAHRAAVHEPRRPWGLSVQQAHEALATHAAREVPPSSQVRLPSSVLAAVDHDEAGIIGGLLASVAAKGGWSKDWPDDPWYRAWVTSAQDAARVEEIVTGLAGGRLAAARSRLDATLVEAGLPPAETADHWDGAFELMVGVRKTLAVLPEDVYLQPLDYLLGATADRAYRHEKGLWLGWRSRRDLRRRAESLLSPEVSLDDLHDALSLAHEQRVAWTAWSGSQDLPRVPDSLDESRRLWDELAADLRWLSERLETTAGGGDLFAVALDDLVARVDVLSRRIDRVVDLPEVAPALDRCLAAGFDDVIADLATRGVPADRIGAEVDHIWWRSFLDEVGRTDARIGGHDGDRLRTMVDEYTRLDLDHLRASRDEVRVRVAARLHDAAGSRPEIENLVRHQAHGAGTGRPVRDLFAHAADLLTDVKPCWAMSPLAVAALLPPGEWFDVVIVDDASQLLVAHAVSGMSRARQVVVVGDDRQPPPLPYTTAALEAAEVVDPDETVPVAGGPTLLDAALDVLPARRLRWQYRARDAALVAFANARVYDGEMVTFPGTSAEPAVRVVHPEAAATASALADVAGGGAGDTRDVMLDAPGEADPEVARVVALVWEHARTRPEESLAVVTLGTARADRIRSALDAALVSEPDAAIRSFVADDGPERLLVTHVDRAIGAERDAVILALGYAPAADGSLPRRFGRLDAEHGDRVLCSALGLARVRATIVTAVTLDALGGHRLGSPGAALVRDLLRSVAGPERESPATPDPLLARLSGCLSADGLAVTTGAGVPPLPIDVAVGDASSSRPVVALLSDGPTYAAIDDLRERERGRAEQLRRLGWEVVRVWGADLLEDPGAQVPRAREALRACEARGVLVDRSRRRVSPPRP